MNKYDELANNIIDMVSEVVLEQHPEIKLMTKESQEDGCDCPSLIYGVKYYNLEEEISQMIKEFKK